MMGRQNCVTLTAVKVVVVLKTICDQQKYLSFEEDLRVTMVENVISKGRIRNGCVIVNRKRNRDRLTVHYVRVREAISGGDEGALDGHMGSTTRIEILDVTSIEVELVVRKYENSDLLSAELRLLLLWVKNQRFSDHLRSFLLCGLGSDKDSVIKYVAAKSDAWLIPLDFYVTRENSRSDLKLREAIDSAKNVARHRLCMIYVEELDRFCRYANPLTLACLESLKDLDCAGNLVFCATTELLSDVDDEWKAAFGRRVGFLKVVLLLEVSFSHYSVIISSRDELGFGGFRRSFKYLKCTLLETRACALELIHL